MKKLRSIGIHKTSHDDTPTRVVLCFGRLSSPVSQTHQGMGKVGACLPPEAVS